ncbi:MAG: carbon-nitrogen hydrolase family protein, partial [Acetobacteraceae bacterium]
MRVSVIQMNQGSEKQANLDQARRLVEAAVAADRPGLVSLPETWTNLGGGRESRQAAAEV